MKAKTKKILYRLLIAFLALVSLVFALSGYVAFVVNRNYFPQEISPYEVLWPLSFVVLSLALVVELFAVSIYSRIAKKEPIQPPQTTTGSSAPDRV